MSYLELLKALVVLREWIREHWASDDSPENEAVIQQAEEAIAGARREMGDEYPIDALLDNIDDLRAQHRERLQK